MRALLVALLAMATVFAGCSGDGDGTSASSTPGCEERGDCPTDQPTGSSSTGPRTTTTAKPPNVPPVISVKVTDANGTATNVTFAGATMTFDASASTDPDGDGLSAIAMVAEDSNKTYDPQLLYVDGEFQTASYTFDRAGVVNITVSGIDMRGDVSTIYTQVFVNSKQIVGETYLFSGTLPDAVGKAADCKGPAGNAAADNLVWTANTFDIQNSTTYVTATVVAPAKGEIALCAPDGTAISGESTTTVTSNPGTVFSHSGGVSGYFVSVISGAPNQKVPIEVVVHYEPQAPAA